jgi:hypothetical protein
MNNADRITGFKLMNHLITYEQSKNTSSSSTSSSNTGDLFGFLNGQKCGIKTVKNARWKRQKCEMETAKNAGQLFRNLNLV